MDDSLGKGESAVRWMERRRVECERLPQANWSGNVPVYNVPVYIITSKTGFSPVRGWSLFQPLSNRIFLSQMDWLILFHSGMAWWQLIALMHTCIM